MLAECLTEGRVGTFTLAQFIIPVFIDGAAPKETELTIPREHAS